MVFKHVLCLAESIIIKKKKKIFLIDEFEETNRSTLQASVLDNEMLQ